MRATVHLLIGLFVGLGFASHARAEPIDVFALFDAPVDYAAEYELAADSALYRGHVIHAPGRERRDFATALGGQAILIRRDTDQIALIWPRTKWYVTSSLSTALALLGGAGGNGLDRRRDGAETIEGERCVRWNLSGAFTGQLWLTRDGIPMKLEGRGVFRGKETEVASHLVSLRRRAVDPAAFDLPEDYRGVPVDLNALTGSGR